MKKMYLMKGMAVLAMGLVAAGCNRLEFDQEAYQQAKEQESKESFMNNVMGGQDIDPNQTWKTTKSVNLTVTPRKDGTLKIYTANPIGNVVASLYTTTVVAGQEKTFTVTRPADAETLYAAVLSADGLIADQLAFAATEASVAVDMTMDAATRGVSRRAATAPTQPNYADETNPITNLSSRRKTVAIGDMPTATTADVVISGSVTTDWNNYNYSNYDKVFIASNAIVTIGSGSSSFKQGAKIYMSSGSKIVCENFWLGSNTILYNDGGTIESTNFSIEGCTVWNKGNITLTNGMWYSANSAAYVYNSGTISAYNGCGLNKNGILWNEGTYTSENGTLYSDAADNKTSAPCIYNSGTITTKALSLNKYAKLWNEGTINADGDLKGGNDETEIYNASGHTITAKYFEFNNNNQVLWNEGTMTITGAINIYNSSATVMNHGTLSGTSYNNAAGAKFYNAENASVVISGETKVTNNKTAWVNDGTYTTGTYLVNGGGNHVFNNCRLTVNRTFTMGSDDGSRFVLNGNASVICKNFNWTGDNYFWLGGGSIVQVADTLKFNNKNTDRGFFNTTSQYAVISAKDVITDNNTSQWRAWYEGKIYVDADSHFDQVVLNSSQKTIYASEEVEFTRSKGTAPLKWDESTCRPAYNGGGGGGGIVEPIMYYYYAFEDLGAIGDFDFNDVVLRLAAPDENGESTVQLMAAGGTLPVQVTYDGANLGREVHKEFDVDTNVMVNTGSGVKKDSVTLGTVKIAKDAIMSELPFGIVVTGNDGSSITVTNTVDRTGTAPLMIVVAGYSADIEGIASKDVGKWFWARERINISTAYPQFGAWGANVSENENWYYYFTEGKVWKY